MSEIENNKLETLSELKERMSKDNIPMFVPESGVEQVLVVDIPKRVLDIDEKVIKYVMLVKILPDGELKYTIIDEKTVDNMFCQIKEMNKNEDTNIAYV
jgi:hypothetical protein